MKNNQEPPTPIRLHIQDPLRRALPVVLGCVDYLEQERLLLRVDRILRVSGVERVFVKRCLEAFERGAGGREVKAGELVRHAQVAERALRCTVLKSLLGEDYREMSVRLAQCELFRWFCRLPELESVRVPGKSTLQQYATLLGHEEMEGVLGALREALSDDGRAQEIGMEAEIDLAVAWVDSTCLRANVHFPTDWVLLRDAVRTLMKSVAVIRRHGLKVRMPEPEIFLAKINAHSMAMAGASRRKAGGRKERKAILRKIKRLVAVVRAHARRYRQALDLRWGQTDLSRAQAEVVLRRIDNVLGQLPAALRQAHERIIGGRKVPNAQKILSLYEGDLHVVVRGKAGAEVEFGNSLFVAESASGFIMDHDLLKDGSPGDTRWLAARLEKLREASGGRLAGVVADRGFESQACRDMLGREGLFDGLCPRDPRRLGERMESDDVFAASQKRRGQTEGRIGILKNVFLQKVPRAKGFANRQLQVDWAVLAHNLWVAARLPWRVPGAALPRAA